MSSKQLTNKWIRNLPSITGQDAYEVSKYVKITYWDEIRRDYEAFIREAIESKEVSVCLIVGEWGLGKTSSFRSFALPIIKELGAEGILIKARDYIDFFKKMLDEDLLIAEKATRALLLVIIKMLKLDFSKDLDTEQLLKRVLERIDKPKLFVFIDEFESIIDEKPEIASKIIEGIASLVNGEFKPLSKSGRFSGALHLILAMTPQALSRFQSEIAYQETRGRMTRRIKKQIKLRPLSRSECYELLYGYLNYIYENKLPKKLPIPTLSIFDSIIWGGRQNPGYIILILNALLSSLICKEYAEPKIRVAEIRDVEKALASPLLEELGHKIQPIDLSYLNNLETIVTGDIENEKIREIVRRVFKVLAISPFPLSLEEIKALTNIMDEAEIESALSIISRKLSNIYRTPIIKFFSTSKRIVIEKISELIKDYELKDLLEEKLNKLFDYLTRFTYSDGTFRDSEIILPYKDYLEEIIAELSENTGIKEEYLIKILTSLYADLKAENTLYRLPADVYYSIYPPPCPICRAVKEKDEAYKIWRDSVREVTEGTVDALKLGLAMTSLLIPDIFFNENDYYEDGIIRKRLEYGPALIELRFVPIAVLDRKTLILNTFLKRFEKLFNKAPIFIIFTKQELVKAVNELKKKLGELYHIEVIPIGIMDLAKIYSLRELRERGLTIYESEVRTIIRQTKEHYKIDDNYLKNIISACDEKGFVISKLTWDPKSSLTDISRVYDYYLVYPRAIIDPRKIFKWVEEHIKKYIFYGLRSKHVPCAIDIESGERLQVLENYLIRNGFLKETPGGLVVTNSKIEKRILKIIQEREESTLEELKKFFIFDVSENIGESILRNVYLETLMRKGYLEFESSGSKLKIIKLNELESKARKALEIAKRELEERSIEFKRLAHLFVAKKRGKRCIDLNDFLKELQDLITAVSIVKDELDKRRLLKTSIRLVDSLFTTYIKIIELAFEDVRKLRDEIKTTLQDIKNNVEIACECLRSINIEIDPSQIIEFSEIEKIIEALNHMLEAQFSCDDIENIIATNELLKMKKPIEEIFDFRKLDLKDLNKLRKAYFFNLKNYYVREVYSKINEMLVNLQRGVKRIEHIKDFYRQIYRKLSEIEEYLKKIYGFETIQQWSIDLSGLINKNRLRSELSFNEFLTIIEDIYDKENEIRKSIEKIRLSLRSIISKMNDVNATLNLLRKIDEHINLGNLEKSPIIEKAEEAATEFREKLDELKSYLLKEYDYRKLLEITQQLKEQAEQLVSLDLQSIIDEVYVREKEIEKNIAQAQDYLKTLRRILPLISGKIRKEDVDNFETRILALRTMYLEGRNYIRIENELNKLLKRLQELIGDFRNPVIEEFLNILYGTQVSQLSLREIVTQLSKNLEKDEKEILELILKKLKKLFEEKKIEIIIKKR